MATYSLTSNNPSWDLLSSDIIDCSYYLSYRSLYLNPGVYKLLVWGSKGNAGSGGAYGKGGYSEGLLKLNTKALLYIYVGAPGYNGGGSGCTNSGGSGSGGSGGGSSDIRINSTSLYARVIVAGGGGGGGNTAVWAGDGGGINGLEGCNNTPIQTGLNRSGGGGTQTAGGITWDTGGQASFGLGSSGSGYSCGGGGGGWYGGAGAYDNDADADGRNGGGGSGYVYTEETASYYPSGCLLNSSYYLTDTKMIAGNTSMPSVSGGTEKGHADYGHIKITVLDIFEYKEYDITQLTNIPAYSCILNCPYTGQTINFLALPGIYLFLVWGAQGGEYNSSYYGGHGGYSEGTLELHEPTQLYLRVGGQGSFSTANGEIPGGFNGGGKAYTASYTSYPVGSGGGASDIRIGEDSLYARVIVAGGGGGSMGGSSYYGYGGYGGGTSAGRGNSNYGYYGYGGTSSLGGNSYYSSTANSTSYGDLATFGLGANGKLSGSYITGGGGGWYGGGYDYMGGAGGGSGYVYTSSTYSQYPSGCLLSSKYYLTGAQTLGGNSSITLPNNTTSTGNTGNGYIRITYISIPLLKKSRKIKFSKNDSITLPPGKYKLECWGAQGGTHDTYIGGKGGYSTGVLNIQEDTTLYINVGDLGKVATSSTTVTGGSNGGGNGYTNNYPSYVACSGGGASDIRIGADNIKRRIIVAGGGGGAFGGTSYHGNGGAGGGTSGEKGYSNYSSGSYAGLGGTLTAGGTSYYGGTANSTSYGTLAAFGTGASANSSSSYASGGGGGWYGGGYSAYAGGGGGSGYVYTESTYSNHPYDSQLGSQYYLTETQNIDGTQVFLSPKGKNEIGHSGNGYVIITILESELLSGLFIDEETVNIEQIVKSILVDCTGLAREILLNPGSYKLQCWGALGGSYSTSYYGGKGGYSEGILTLKELTKVFLYVGGQGNVASYTGIILGGFNGGGTGQTSSVGSYASCSGGGASDIRIGTDSLYSRVIVAGGGGGAMGVNNQAAGGAGGGTSGVNGSTASSGSYTPGLGGSQTAGGTSYLGTTAGTTSYGTLASFGQGAGYTSSYGSGGGGGWYGGGYSAYAGGGGGSGYVYTSSTASNYPSGCLLTSNYYLTEALTVAGNTSFEGIDGNSETGHEGDGCIKITAITGGIRLSNRQFNWILLNVQEGDVIEFDECINKIILPSGKYKLECWGALGNALGGKGGYSVGNLTLLKPTCIYGHVGDEMSYTNSFGGKSSDIRINTDSLYSRVIIAGGGGGSTQSSSQITIGTGGGELGGNGIGVNEQSALASGGTQTSGGTCSGTDSEYTGESGSFGYGGAGASHEGYISGGGGGDGWYGGAGGMSVSATEGRPGGGGSGYVYNEETYMNYPEGCLLNPKYFLENSSTLGGTSSFLSPLGEPVTGNKGNGYIKITAEAIFLDNFFSRVDNKLRGTRKFLYKDTTWKNITKIYKYANGYLLIWEK